MECAICMDTIEKPIQALVTECTHTFHEKCLRQWAFICCDKRYPDCPLCRRNVTLDLKKRRDREMYWVKEIIRLHAGPKEEYDKAVAALNGMLSM
jgi:hypothetical protein